MTAKKKAESQEQAGSDDKAKDTIVECGIIMPISTMGSYSADHWLDVLKIISDSVKDAGFLPKPVWESKTTNIIHSKIVNNLYETPIAVCDVSGKNSNVMFELGMRLAFDKPTIILKDDNTEYFFDGSPIEYIQYPKDLRFPKIQELKKELTSKIRILHEQADSDGFKSFLTHFGKFDVKGLETQNVSVEKLLVEILEQVKEMQLSNISEENLSFQFAQEVPYRIYSLISKLPHSDKVRLLHDLMDSPMSTMNEISVLSNENQLFKRYSKKEIATMVSSIKRILKDLLDSDKLNQF